MKTLSLIIFAVVIYAAVSVEQTILSVYGLSQNADQNFEAVEILQAVTRKTITKDDFIIPTDGRARHLLTIEPFVTTSFGRRIRSTKEKERRHRKCQNKEDEPGCKKVDELCKKNKECCGNKADEGNTPNHCLYFEGDFKGSCQKCLLPGDKCTRDRECCPQTYVANVDGKKNVLYFCKQPDNANQNQCCSSENTYCPHDDACCSSYCKKAEGFIYGQCRKKESTAK